MWIIAVRLQYLFKQWLSTKVYCSELVSIKSISTTSAINTEFCLSNGSKNDGSKCYNKKVLNANLGGFLY